jgi:hypothetical protein
MQRKIFLWEIIGMIFIILVGSFFHFLFEISGYWAPIGGFVAVNESTWEHLKLGYWPLIIFALIEYKFVEKDAHNFIIGKVIAAYIIPVFIIAFFYSYTAILGADSLFFDILSFILAVIIGQLVSYKVLVLREFSRPYRIISWIALVILGILFIVFTYFPPEFFLFQDPISGLYGIIPH